MEFVKKLQKLSLPKRRIIFWTIMVALGLIFLILFVIITAHRLRNLQLDNLNQDMNIPSFNLPELEQN